MRRHISSVLDPPKLSNVFKKAANQIFGSSGCSASNSPLPKYLDNHIVSSKNSWEDKEGQHFIDWRAMPSHAHYKLRPCTRSVIQFLSIPSYIYSHLALRHYLIYQILMMTDTTLLSTS